MQQIQFESDGIEQYMILDCRWEETDGYWYRLMQHYSMPGFMACAIRELNGKRQLQYRLKYRTTVRDVLGHLPMTEKRVRNMVNSVIEAMRTAQEYLLPQNGILWRNDCIFMEADTGKLTFCYCPDGGDTTIRQCLDEWIRAVEKKQEKAMVLLLQFYDQVTEPDCSVEKLAAWMQEYGYREDQEEKEPELYGRACELQRQGQSEYDVKHAMQQEAENESKKEKTPGMQLLQIFMGILILGNIILSACIFLQLLSYAYLKYLIGGMGALIVSTIFYMQSDKEETPEQMMEAYREEMALQYRKEEPERVYQAAEEEELQEEQGTTVLQEGTVTDDRVVEEEKPKHLCLIREKGINEPPVLLDNSVVIGSLQEGCNYVLREVGVSRMHAKLMHKEDGIYILDLNSTNGTYLNGEKLQCGKEYNIEEGDQISFAKSTFFVVDAQ